MNISALNIGQIKELLSQEISEELLVVIASDPRQGVRTLVQKYHRIKEKQLQERARLDGLLKYERELWEVGLNYVAGIDEVGRGPLAGPVVAAAVILPRDSAIEGINDSKKLTPQKRRDLEKAIKKDALAYSISIVSEQEIDEINIYQATLKAMGKAVGLLKIRPEFLLVDAVTIPALDIPQKPIIHGDAISYSIAAASILAKEARDRMMDEFDLIYPQYGFAQHKGYGTAFHLEAINKYGPCPIHRKSFGPVLNNNP